MVKNCKRTVALEIAAISAILYDYAFYTERNGVYAIQQKMAPM